MTQTLPTGSTPAKAAALIAVMCMAQVLGMLGVFAFPAMLPHFMDLWALTNSQAGWISGIYFAGYSIAVPVLTSVTDRIDSRKIYLASCFVSMIANITAADPDRRGATMALQSLAGFAAASLSPIVVGVVLDLTGGGNSTLSWGLTFATMGLTAILGLVLLLRVHTRDNP